MKTKEEQIKEHLEGLNDGELLSIYDDYCEEAGYMDDKVYWNDDELFEVFFSNTIDAVRAVSFGSYNYTDRFVKFNGYANLDSSDYLTGLIDIDDMVSYIADNIDSFDLDIDFEEED